MTFPPTLLPQIHDRLVLRIRRPLGQQRRVSIRVNTLHPIGIMVIRKTGPGIHHLNRQGRVATLPIEQVAHLAKDIWEFGAVVDAKPDGLCDTEARIFVRQVQCARGRGLRKDVAVSGRWVQVRGTPEKCTPSELDPGVGRIAERWIVVTWDGRVAFVSLAQIGV